MHISRFSWKFQKRIICLAQIALQTAYHLRKHFAEIYTFQISIYYVRLRMRMNRNQAWRQAHLSMDGRALFLTDLG